MELPGSGVLPTNRIVTADGDDCPEVPLGATGIVSDPHPIVMRIQPQAAAVLTTKSIEKELSTGKSTELGISGDGRAPSRVDGVRERWPRVFHFPIR